MRAVTEKVFERVLDETFLNYSQLRFISDEEVSDFKAEFFKSLSNNALCDKYSSEDRLLELTFRLKDNE